MKKILYSALALMAVAVMSSCNAIEKATERTAEVGSVTIPLAQTPKSVPEAVQYSGEYSINRAMYPEIDKHIGWVKSVDFSGIDLSGLASATISKVSLKASVSGAQIASIEYTATPGVSYSNFMAAKGGALMSFGYVVLGKLIDKNFTGNIDFEYEFETAADMSAVSLIMNDVVVKAGLSL